MIFGYFRDPFTQMQDEKTEHEFKIKKQQEEMEKVFQQKVQEKEQKLKEHEREVRPQFGNE